MSISHQDVKSDPEILYATEWNKLHAITGIPTLIETQTVTGSAVTDLTFSGLDGDVELVYLLLTKFINAYNGAINIYLYPNNLSTNQVSYYHQFSASHSIGGGAGAWRIGNPTVLNATTMGRIWVFAKTGTYRFYMRHGFRTIATAGIMWTGYWTDTSTNLTSLVIHADQANALGVGSKVTLYKLGV